MLMECGGSGGSVDETIVSKSLTISTYTTKSPFVYLTISDSITVFTLDKQRFKYTINIPSTIVSGYKFVGYGLKMDYSGDAIANTSATLNEGGNRIEVFFSKVPYNLPATTRTITFNFLFVAN